MNWKKIEFELVQLELRVRKKCNEIGSRKLSKILRLHQSYLSSWLNGKRKISYEKVIQFAKILELWEDIMENLCVDWCVYIKDGICTKDGITVDHCRYHQITQDQRDKVLIMICEYIDNSSFTRAGKIADRLYKILEIIWKHRMK